MYYQSKDKKKSEDYFDFGNKEIFNTSRYNSHQYQERIVKTMELYLKKNINLLMKDIESMEKKIFL